MRRTASWKGRSLRVVGPGASVRTGTSRFLRRYLEAAATTIKPATLESYTWAMEKHALPLLRDLRVRELARAHV
jgi:hypothetical protein